MPLHLPEDLCYRSRNTTDMGTIFIYMHMSQYIILYVFSAESTATLIPVFMAVFFKRGKKLEIQRQRCKGAERALNVFIIAARQSYLMLMHPLCHPNMKFKQWDTVND